MDYQIRKLGIPDAARAADVIRRSFATVAAEFSLTRQNCPGNGAFINDRQVQAMLERGICLYGLTVGPELAGAMAVKENKAGVWYLEKAAVLPEFRGRGYGAALLNRAVDHVRENSGRVIRIGIIEANSRLRLWYEGHGFRPTQSKSFDSLPFVVLYMEKELERE